LNRRIYYFNFYFDKYVFLPVTRGYEFVMPNFAERGVSNFFSNLSDIGVLVNSALQVKGKSTWVTTQRLVVNSTVGVVGLWDPATKWGRHKQSEDFGQTLGRYGIGKGPFLVLPFFGPSNLRDGIGLVADTAIGNFTNPIHIHGNEPVVLTTKGVEAIDKRHNESFRYYRSGSPFEYELIRMLYSKKRDLEVRH
jgi:phospholipid-binding lipoprotein MlaA